MPRLLFISDTFPPNIGGSEGILLDMARGAQAAGHEVRIFTPASERSTTEEATFDQAEDFEIIRSRLWRRLFRFGGSGVGILSRISRAAIIFHVFHRALRLPADIIIVGHVLPLGNVALAIKRIKSVPVVVVTYGEEVTMYSRGGRMRSMLLSVLRGADAITCLTNDSATEISGLAGIPPAAITVLPPPADTAITTVQPASVEALRDKYNLNDRRVLLTVSRLVPRKGIDVTLRALAQVRDEFPDVFYLIVGEGPYRTELEKLTSDLHLTHIVIFAGPHPPPLNYPFYHLCEIFLMPNRIMPDGEREGYGIVFVEAALAGKPVIGGRTGGAFDAIVDKETGILVDPNDPAEIATAIRTLLNDNVLARSMGEAGKMKALRTNTTEITRQRFLQVVENVIARNER